MHEPAAVGEKPGPVRNRFGATHLISPRHPSPFKNCIVFFGVEFWDTVMP